jgi:hypothetical protein
MVNSKTPLDRLLNELEYQLPASPTIDHVAAVNKRYVELISAMEKRRNETLKPSWDAAAPKTARR